MGWIADLIGIEQVDRAADTWRWWAAIGSFIGLILLRRRLSRLIWAWIWGMLDSEEHTILAPIGWLLTTFCAALFMIAAFIGGLIIPLANNDGITWLSKGTLEFHAALAFVWLLFGSAAWGIAISLAPRAREIAAASIILWWAAYIATGKMAGLVL